MLLPLAEQGMHVVDISTPTLEEMAGGHDRWETFVFYDAGRDWMVIDRFRPRLDLRRQVELDEIRLTFVRRGKAEAQRSTSTRLAVVFPRELFHTVSRAGFSIQGAYSDYDGRAWRPGKDGRNLVLVLSAAA